MNNKLKKSPLKTDPVSFWSTPAGQSVINAGVSVGVGLLGSLFGRKKRRRQARKEREAEAAYNARMKEYEDMEFTPIDPSIADQENLFEDMEIDMTGFEMQRKAFLQSQANILQTLQSVGGTSGAAGLAQALSIQADKQTEQMGLTVSQMMNRSRELRIQEDSRINQAMTQIELANAEGARQFELEKLTTLLGVDAQRLAGARGQINARRAQTGSIFSALGQIGGGYLAGGGKLPNFAEMFKKNSALPNLSGTTGGGIDLTRKQVGPIEG